MTYIFLHPIMHLLLFISHLIRLFSVTWLSLLYKFTRFFIYPLWFLSDEEPMLETLDYTIRIGSTPTILYFDFYLYSAYTGHYVYYSFSISLFVLDILRFVWYVNNTLHTCTSYCIMSCWAIMYHWNYSVKSIETFIIRCHKKNTPTCAVLCDFVW